MTVNRIYYRRHFLHIGHLQTLIYNDKFAQQNGGVCYAIVDDRQDVSRLFCIQEDIDYLQLKNTKIISVAKYFSEIIKYTQTLIGEGIIFMQGLSQEEAIRELSGPTKNVCIYLRLPDGRYITVGYFRWVEERRCHVLVFIFDYVVKVLDMILGVTHVIETNQNDLSDQLLNQYFDSVREITYSELQTYHIQGFKYTKIDWPEDIEQDDPRLLTFKGLKSRRVPCEILYDFYERATELRRIHIEYLNTLIKQYFTPNITSKYSAVCDPIEVRVSNWKDDTTEFVPRKLSSLVPLSNKLYIDRFDFSTTGSCDRFGLHKSIKLKHTYMLTCNDISIREDGKISKITGNLVQFAGDKHIYQNCIHWVSCESGEECQKAQFINYNGFFTGENSIQEPYRCVGYVDKDAVGCRDYIFFDRVGYYFYDEYRSKLENIPTFIKICDSRHTY
jgi:glutamyl/glutaminyl-tRNA synthetase